MVAGMSDPIDLGQREVARLDLKRRLRWSFLLAFFMRAAAAAWFVKGVGWWAGIFGFDERTNFEALRAAAKAVAIGFGVLDLVAAVGLWLLAAWGGVMWLLAVTTEIVLTVMAPRVFSASTARLGLLAALILVYLILSSLSAREPEPAP